MPTCSRPTLPFLSTLSLRRATNSRQYLRLRSGKKRHNNFYPRSPCGERPACLQFIHRVNNHFYPRSPCGERLAKRPACGARPNISIHALLAESDMRNRKSDLLLPHFYPRSPCGERRLHQGQLQIRLEISIHALLAESDLTPILMPTKGQKFLSTLSLRRATLRLRNSKKRHNNFYPRSPCGERPVRWQRRNSESKFLSTLSLRRATGINRINRRAVLDFYPRSPCGERRQDFER